MAPPPFIFLRFQSLVMFRLSLCGIYADRRAALGCTQITAGLILTFKQSTANDSNIQRSLDRKEEPPGGSNDLKNQTNKLYFIISAQRDFVLAFACLPVMLKHEVAEQDQPPDWPLEESKLLVTSQRPSFPLYAFSLEHWRVLDGPNVHQNEPEDDISRGADATRRR